MSPPTESADPVLVETRHSNTRVLTLNRPAKRNALSQSLIKELLTQLEIASAEPRVASIVIAGSGTMFSAGADIKEISQLDAEGAQRIRYLEDLCNGMKSVRKPIIVAVEGKALGGGFELALMADFIVATSSVEFYLPEVTIGLIPGAGGTQRLTNVVGKYRAMNMVLLNEPLSATEAHKLGLVCKLVDPGNALAGALELAEKLGSQSPSAIVLAKEAICRADELGRDEQFERALYYSSFGTSDKVEGVGAFLEKRKPTWKAYN